MNNNNSSKVHSFDVFDTVVTRRIGSPASSFFLLGNKLKSLGLIDCSAEAFAYARLEAERRAFKNAGGLDSKVSIQQIYYELSVALRLNAGDADCIIAHELALEEYLICPIVAAKEILERSRAQNYKVAFISDMYLGSEFIKAQLVKHKLWKVDDLLYVSSEYAKSKHTGELFREFARKEEVSVKKITHHGNHPHSDVKVAKRNGLSVVPFYQGNLNRYEGVLESKVGKTDGLSSAMAGASRVARLTISANNSKEKQLRNVSASVAAPMLTGFVLWILHRAKKLGLKRLYFVSRDGQILLEIASRIISQLDYDCELRYLYGSRQAWVLPSIINATEESLTRGLGLEAHHVSVKAALDRLGLKPLQIKDKLIEIGIRENRWQDNLALEERVAFKNLILKDKSIQSLILENAEQKREIVLKYLGQEGLLDSQSYAIVDLGVNGTLHTALSEILAFANAGPLLSFYLGLSKKMIKDEAGKVESYFYDNRNNTGIKIEGLVLALEVVCSGDHGSVIGYKVIDGKIKPILTEERNVRVLEWGYSKIYDTICCFADNLLLDKTLLNPWADVRDVTFNTFELFWKSPSADEASSWGSFMMEDGWGNHAKWLRIAEGYRKRNLFNIIKKGQLQLRKQWWSWGALALTPIPLRPMLTGMVMSQKGYSYIKPRLNNRLKSFKSRLKVLLF